jgi:hypothetical protein
MGYSFQLESFAGMRSLHRLTGCRLEAADVLQANFCSQCRWNIDAGPGRPVQEMNPARYTI